MDPQLDVDPMVHRRRVSERLRSERIAHDRTLQAVADRLDWSISKVIRIEGASVGVSSTDLQALLRFYGVTDEKEVAELVEEARQGRRRAWWGKYRSIFGKTFLDYLGHESSARAIRQFQPLLLPGLAQTPEYARAVIAATPQPAEDVEARLRSRMERQDAVYGGGSSADITAVIDEGVLRREIGGSEVMRRQLLHLLELSRAGRLSVRVLPFSAGAHPSLGGGFTLVEVSDQVVVYSEDSRGDMLTRGDPDEASRYEETFSRLVELAASAERSAELIRSIADGLARGHSDDQRQGH